MSRNVRGYPGPVVQPGILFGRSQSLTSSDFKL